MNFSMNEKIIKKLCGVTAFKRGKSYYQAGKVHLQAFQQDDVVIKASVKAGDDFDVTVEVSPNGNVTATCTCPPIGFVKTYCQHIAAVLLGDRSERANRRAIGYENAGFV